MGATVAPAVHTAVPSVGQHPTVYAYASKRWAAAVFGVLYAPSDFRTVTAWGRHIGAAAGTLRGWCRSAGVGSKPSLDFARMLRATALVQPRRWEIRHLLDIVDERTVAKLFAKAGCPPGAADHWRPTVERFLDGQHFVEHTSNLGAIVELLVPEGLVSEDWAESRRLLPMDTGAMGSPLARRSPG